MEREGLSYLVELGQEEELIIETKTGLYSKRNLTRLYMPTMGTLEVSNLTSFIDYCKSNFDNVINVEVDKLLIQVVSPREVRLLLPLNVDMVRPQAIKAIAILPDNIRYGSYLDVESFNIMLQSSFVVNTDRELLLKFTGLIKEEKVKDTGDNGVSQKVTIKTGIATIGEAEIPNPVRLAPYRTFPEIEQPESKFIFRMKDGPIASLFEADGGAWRNQAMKHIKNYINIQLGSDRSKFEIIS